MFCDLTKMGELTLPRKGTDGKLSSFDRSYPNTFIVQSKKVNGGLVFEMKDSTGAVVARIDALTPQVVQLKFHKKLSENEKKLIMAETTVLCRVVFKINSVRLTWMEVSRPITTVGNLCNTPVVAKQYLGYYLN